MMLLRLSIAAAFTGSIFLACADDLAAGRSALEPTPEAGSEPDGSAGSPGSSPDAASAPDTAVATNLIAGYDANIAAAICAKLASCCSTASYNAFFAPFAEKPYDLKTPPPPGQCAAALATQFGKLHNKWAASIALNRIEFAPARATKCVEDMNGAACGVALTKQLYAAACVGTRGNEVFVKRAVTGAACTDIADGTFFGECDPKLGYCGTDGTCKAWQTTGQPCSVIPTRQFCAPDLDCSNLSTKPGTCSAAPIVRQIGEGCVATNGPLVFCAAGSYCDWDTSLCAPTKPDGAACTYDDDCATSHPYTCSPFGNGTCGSSSFCSGNTDGGGT